jgi:MFS family permease
LGYKEAFISASALVFVTLIFCFLYVVEVPYEQKVNGALGIRAMDKKTLIGWGLCFTATVQLMFLPSILPNIFQEFKIEGTTALEQAGLVVMFYTATAMMGTYVLCKMASRVRYDRLIISAGILSIGMQSLLSICPGIVSFTVVRMLQTAMAAAIIPLVFSIFTSHLDGRVIGFLNSGRFGGNALGPMIATSILAASSLSWLYLSVSGMTLLALLTFAFYFGGVEEKMTQGSD